MCFIVLIFDCVCRCMFLRVFRVRLMFRVRIRHVLQRVCVCVTTVLFDEVRVRRICMCLSCVVFV